MIEHLRDGHYWAWLKGQTDQKLVVYIEGGKVYCHQMPDIKVSDIEVETIQAVARPSKFVLKPETLKLIIELKCEANRLRHLIIDDGELSMGTIAAKSGISKRRLQDVYWQPGISKSLEWRKIADPLIAQRKEIERKLSELTHRKIAEKMHVSVSVVGTVAHQYNCKFFFRGQGGE